MSDRRVRRRLGAVARLLVSVTLLVAVTRIVDLGEVAARLAELDGRWAALGLALTVPHFVLLGWRWRYTAARLGIDLPLRIAVREYYLSVLLNQLLPGGVVGDASRAWRHARTPAPTGQAVRAVVLERASAQLLMTATALVSLLALPLASGFARGGVATLSLLIVVLALLTLLRGARASSWAGAAWADTRAAILSRDALPVQLLTSVVVVASYLGLYLIAARAVGVDTPLPRLLPLVAPVLMTMLIPISVAGWGVREGAAAALWGSVGLTPEEGVAISVAYGLLVLVSTAPGVPVLMRASLGDRSRRARPLPGGSGGTEGAEPRPDPAPDRG